MEKEIHPIFKAWISLNPSSIQEDSKEEILEYFTTCTECILELSKKVPNLNFYSYKRSGNSHKVIQEFKFITKATSRLGDYLEFQNWVKTLPLDLTQTTSKISTSVHPKWGQGLEYIPYIHTLTLFENK